MTSEHEKSALELVKYLKRFIEDHPAYRRSDYLIPVPFYGNKSFDLPAFLVDNLCSALNIKNGKYLVQKTKKTESMKDLNTVMEKAGNIRNAFQISENTQINGKLITIVDDIYESGTTLHELAITLQNEGAQVQGLVVTKTVNDPR